MAKFIGRLVKLGIDRETVRGAGASAVYQIPRVAFTFDDKVVQARSIGSLGYLADSEEAFVTTKYGQGDVEGEIRSKSFGLFLYAMLGSLSTTGPVDSAYTHAFTINESNQHQSLCFVVTDENTREIYPLVMLDSMEITAELDAVIKFAASFMSKCSRDTVETVPAVVTESKFTKKHLQFRIADNIAGLAAASAISLKSLSLRIAKNVTLDDVLGTAEPEDILNRQLAVEGTLTLNYEAETYKNYMKNGTSKAVEIYLLNTDDTIGSSTRPSLKIQLPKVDFFDWAPDYGLEDIVTQTVSFKANRDVANAQNIIYLCQLVNDVASY
jgi:hypothetical protein